MLVTSVKYIYIYQKWPVIWLKIDHAAYFFSPSEVFIDTYKLSLLKSLCLTKHSLQEVKCFWKPLNGRVAKVFGFAF